MLTTLILACLPAAPAQAETRYAEVAVDQASIRSFYDNKSAAVLEVGKGFPVQVVAELVPWSKVRVPGGFDVWVHQDYVEFDGGLGTITSSRVRIRPLPSTAAESHALGHFGKGDQVTRLGVEGDWVKVRYNDQVAAWIQTKDLSFLDRELSQWQRIWSNMADMRIAVPLPEEVEVEVEGEEGSESDGAIEESTDVSEAGTSSSESAGSTDASSGSSSDSGVTDSAVSAVAPWVPFKAADVAIKPGKYQLLADKQLTEYSSAVTKSNDNWDRAKIDNLEMVYGNVIWHSVERGEVDAARKALTKIDGLRRFYIAALAADARRAEVAGDSGKAKAIQALRTAELKPRSIQGGGTAVEVGWVEYQPKVNARIPYVVVRGSRSIPLHSYDGHHKLRDFINHEIVVRGTWRADKSVVDGRVLAITELRVLPVRRK